MCDAPGSSQSYSCEANIQDYYWRNYIPHHIPDDALDVGCHKYVGQVLFRHFLLPACIDPYNNQIIAVRLRKRIFTENIKILCTTVPHKFYWQYVDFNDNSDHSYLTNAVNGGFEDNTTTYIGKACHMNEWKIGKVFPKERIILKGLRVWNPNGAPITSLRFVPKIRRVPEANRFILRKSIHMI
ncbi:hypothetical protein Trydic_g3043 [Trypoxylus dichotomus]